MGPALASVPLLNTRPLGGLLQGLWLPICDVGLDRERTLSAVLRLAECEDICFLARQSAGQEDPVLWGAGRCHSCMALFSSQGIALWVKRCWLVASCAGAEPWRLYMPKLVPLPTASLPTFGGVRGRGRLGFWEPKEGLFPGLGQHWALVLQP